MYIPVLLIHSPIYRHFGCFFALSVVNNAKNMGIQVSLQDPAFNPFRYIPNSRIAGSYGNCFNVLRNHLTASYSGCTILHFYQECTSAPVSLHPHPHLFSIFCFWFLIVAIQTDVRWYLIVLICISLISNVKYLFMHWWVIHFFEEMSVQDLCPFLNHVCIFVDS